MRKELNKQKMEIKGIEMTWMRHGETTLNKDNIFCGRIDCELTEEAKKQAYVKRFSIGSFDYVYVSPLKRTWQTASLVYPFIKPVKNQLIIEKSLGIWEGVEKNKISQELVKAFRENKYLPKGSESQEEVWNRISLFIQMISNCHQNGEKILVVSHNGCMKEIRSHILNDKTYHTTNLETISFSLEKDN